MIRQCAWCGRVVGQRAPLEDKSVTHGICQRCRGQILRMHKSSASAAGEDIVDNTTTHEPPQRTSA